MSHLTSRTKAFGQLRHVKVRLLSGALAGLLFLLTTFSATAQPDSVSASEYVLPETSQPVLIIETSSEEVIRFGDAFIYAVRPYPITLKEASTISIRTAGSVDSSSHDGALFTLTSPVDLSVTEPGASPKQLSFETGRLTVFSSVEAARAAGRYPVSASSDEKAPPSRSSVTSSIRSTDEYSRFLEVFEEAGLDELEARTPFTVFAPTDAAFERLPADTLDALLAPENRDRLREVLKFHVAPYVLRLDDLSPDAVISSYVLDGSQLDIRRRGDDVILRGQTEARLVGPSTKVEGSFIYPIDTVLIPPKK